MIEADSEPIPTRLLGMLCRIDRCSFGRAEMMPICQWAIVRPKLEECVCVCQEAKCARPLRQPSLQLRPGSVMIVDGKDIVVIEQF